MTFPVVTSLQVKYDGVLPYVPIRRPTNNKIHNFCPLQLNSRDQWNPFTFNGNFSVIQHNFIPDYEALFASIHDTNPIFIHLHSYNLRSVVSSFPILSLIQSREEAWTTQLASLSNSRLDSVTPEDHSCR